MNQAYLAAVAVSLAISLAIIATRAQHNTSGDWWSPPMLLSYSILIGAPGSLLLGLDPSSVYMTIERTNTSVDPYVVLGLTGVYSIALYTAQFFGAFSRHAETTGRRIGLRIDRTSHFAVTPNYGDSARFGAALTMLGIVGWLYMLGRIGGLAQLWSDIQQRTRVTSGLAYITSSYSVSLLLGLTLILHYATRASRHVPLRRRILVVALVLTISFALVSLGGRGGLVIVALTVVLSLNYWHRAIRPFAPRIVAVVLALLVLIVLLGLPRLPDIEIGDFISDTNRVISTASDQFNNSLAFRLTETERNATMVAYFSKHDVWLGKGYFSLITAPVPRNVRPEKPPVDDGIYLYNMSLGTEVEPNQNLSNYRWNSWPVGNWAGFMNWHLPGLVFLGFLSGYLARLVYGAMVGSMFNPYLLFLYVNTVGVSGSLNLSVYGIVGLLTRISTALVLLFLVFVATAVLFPKSQVKHLKTDPTLTRG